MVSIVGEKVNNMMVKYGSSPKILTGNDILHQLQDVHCGKFGKNNNNLDRKRKRSPSELNWTKKKYIF